MAIMDMSTSVTKVRRSIPRILSSSKKNSQLSPATSNHTIKDEPDSSEWSVDKSPEKDHVICTADQEGKCSDEKCMQMPVTSEIEIEKSKSKDSDNDSKNTLEIHVNKMVTIRQGPQLHVPPRTLRCALAANSSEEWDATKSLTPNELLLALVNYFAPPMEVEETPPLLERELTSLDTTYGTANEETVLETDVAYTSDVPAEPVSQIQPIASHISNTASDGLSTTSSKYPPLTLGGAIGIRRPRSSNSQAMNNLTLDQLNPTLAEALAAMKAKSGCASKSSGSTVFSNSSESYTRRESLPTRMSGPVTLESLAPPNSVSSDGSASTSGHIVSFNGQTTEVPEEIHCHLCDYPMKLCLRKTKYKGEIREYAAYRCLRKGCQTFRSVRKVIEPDYPYPRKRKPDESYEIFDSCGTGGNSGSSANDHSNEANDSDAPTGTLIYVKQEINTEQMEKMLEFDFKFFNEKPGPIHTIPKLMFGRLNMSLTELDEHLKTARGQKKIQQAMMRFQQPPTPRCVIEAVEHWEASHEQDQFQAQPALCPVQPAKPLAPTSTSPTFIPSVASSRPSPAQTLLPYSGLAPPLSPPPYPPHSSPSHNSVSCSYQVNNIFDPNAMYEYPSCGTSTQLSSMLSQSCSMTSQSHSQNIRTQQYTGLW